jgi:hypothetical protein
LLFGFEDSRAFRIETGSAAESQQNKREREKKKKTNKKQIGWFSVKPLRSSNSTESQGTQGQ